MKFAEFFNIIDNSEILSIKIIKPGSIEIALKLPSKIEMSTQEIFFDFDFPKGEITK